jgi:hypothetical protein
MQVDRLVPGQRGSNGLHTGYGNYIMEVIVNVPAGVFNPTRERPDNRGNSELTCLRSHAQPKHASLVRTAHQVLPERLEASGRRKMAAQSADATC